MSVYILPGASEELEREEVQVSALLRVGGLVNASDTKTERSEQESCNHEVDDVPEVLRGQFRRAPPWGRKKTEVCRIVLTKTPKKLLLMRMVWCQLRS